MRICPAGAQAKESSKSGIKRLQRRNRCQVIALLELPNDFLALLPSSASASAANGVFFRPRGFVCLGVSIGHQIY
jgi:hypothetical protein